VESQFVSLVTGGEGWHNFHHIFPSDYRASEFGHRNDSTTMFLEAFRRKGWIYDVKETPQHLVNKWVNKFGDGSHLLTEKEEDSTGNTETS
jgi:stearoyl-CoA desaturase (delta-9 desaturase)